MASCVCGLMLCNLMLCNLMLCNCWKHIGTWSSVVAPSPQQHGHHKKKNKKTFGKVTIPTGSFIQIARENKKSIEGPVSRGWMVKRRSWVALTDDVIHQAC